MKRETSKHREEHRDAVLSRVLLSQHHHLLDVDERIVVLSEGPRGQLVVAQRFERWAVYHDVSSAVAIRGDQRSPTGICAHLSCGFHASNRRQPGVDWLG
jgi:hypothetical protein